MASRNLTACSLRSSRNKIPATPLRAFDIPAFKDALGGLHRLRSCSPSTTKGKFMVNGTKPKRKVSFRPITASVRNRQERRRRALRRHFHLRAYPKQDRRTSPRTKGSAYAHAVRRTRLPNDCRSARKQAEEKRLRQIGHPSQSVRRGSHFDRRFFPPKTERFIDCLLPSFPAAQQIKGNEDVMRSTFSISFRS